jgi:hypothetical protein
MIADIQNREIVYATEGTQLNLCVTLALLTRELQVKVNEGGDQALSYIV